MPVNYLSLPSRVQDHRHLFKGQVHGAENARNLSLPSRVQDHRHLFKRQVHGAENARNLSLPSRVQDNRHLFKGQVHDPIMLCLDVKERGYANYVETHVGRADLEVKNFLLNRE